MRINIKKEYLAIIILILLVVALAITFRPVACADFECFQSRMKQCGLSTYINEEDEASWKYRILGKENEKCVVEVTLLNAKEGQFNLKEYEGQFMNCNYDVGVVAYPEKNLNACHGRLKESIQGIIIDKMYRYVITNIKSVTEEFKINPFDDL